MEPIRFHARVIPGRARGRKLGVPTLNFELADVPAVLDEGLYAGRVTVDGTTHLASIHYGFRPTFDDSKTCEAHLIDITLPSSPAETDVEVIEFLRPITKFESAEALAAQMQKDIQKTRVILS
ncbi:hypothetical protein EXS70_01915 [Candidatus Peribacteria bacterium]|nr:hypothetical protein [Candidatus Peribacteria bacterium]